MANNTGGENRREGRGTLKDSADYSDPGTRGGMLGSENEMPEGGDSTRGMSRGAGISGTVSDDEMSGQADMGGSSSTTEKSSGSSESGSGSDSGVRSKVNMESSDDLSSDEDTDASDELSDDQSQAA